MAKKKSSKKVKKQVKENFIAAVAITSVLLNLFFIVGIVMYSSTNDIDEGIYSEAYTRYCVDRYEENVSETEIENKDEEYEQALFNARCVRGEFVPYYSEAVEEYLRDLGY